MEGDNVKLTQDAIETAYLKLPPGDRFLIDKQASILEIILTTSSKPFGHLQALELLAKLGVWMVKNE
jgi:hypothetical protein